MKRKSNGFMLKWMLGQTIQTTNMGRPEVNGRTRHYLFDLKN